MTWKITYIQGCHIIWDRKSIDHTVLHPGTPGLLLWRIVFNNFLYFTPHYFFHYSEVWQQKNIKIALEQVREDGPHKPAVQRESLGGEVSLPPGTVTVFGHPESASPFIQVKLPIGMSYCGKKSRCISFVSKDGPMTQRGTNKTKEQATAAVASWAWQWWETLTESEKLGVEGSVRASAAKRAAGDHDSSAASSKKPKV